MKRLKNILAVLVVISFMISVAKGLSYAQPKIPKEKIPSDIPSDVRKEIERLYSSDIAERLSAVYGLGKMGKKASSAVPFLVGIIGDNTAIEFVGQRVGRTSVSREAIDLLGEIKDPCAIEPLISALKDAGLDVKKYDALALGKIKGTRTDESRTGISISKKDTSGTYVEYEVKDPHAAVQLQVFLQVRSSAASALEKITGQKFGEDPVKWQEWWDKNKGKFQK